MVDIDGGGGHSIAATCEETVWTWGQGRATGHGGDDENAQWLVPTACASGEGHRGAEEGEEGGTVQGEERGAEEKDKEDEGEEKEEEEEGGGEEGPGGGGT